MGLNNFHKKTSLANSVTHQAQRHVSRTEGRMEKDTINKTNDRWAW